MVEGREGERDGSYHVIQWLHLTLQETITKGIEVYCMGGCSDIPRTSKRSPQRASIVLSTTCDNDSYNHSL